MKVFIIGGTGLLGSEGARELLARGHQVTTLARRVSSKDAGLPGSPSTQFVEAARAAYATPAFAAYTNTIVHLYAGLAADMLDRPRRGDIVRWIHVPGARNVRDIGGWTGLRAGRVFRGTELNAVSDHKLKIGSAGKKILLKDLGIKTDLDFRALDAKARGDDGEEDREDGGTEHSCFQRGGKGVAARAGDCKPSAFLRPG